MLIVIHEGVLQVYFYNFFGVLAWPSTRFDGVITYEILGKYMYNENALTLFPILPPNPFQRNGSREVRLNFRRAESIFGSFCGNCFALFYAVLLLLRNCNRLLTANDLHRSSRSSCQVIPTIA